MRMARITIRIPDDLDERVESLLGYNDSKSEFYRKAVEERLEREFPEGDQDADETTADA